MSVGADRLVGALGLAAFVAFAGTALPAAHAPGSRWASSAAAARRRPRASAGSAPGCSPPARCPGPGPLAHGLLLSAGYQLSIAGLLLGTVGATGHTLSPLAVLGAFGASQLAGAVPGPNGASPRDGALVRRRWSPLGVPWPRRVAAVTLKAAVAWLPALALGGVSLLLSRRGDRRDVAA